MTSAMADDMKDLRAAEYALGTLRGEDCAEASRLAASDPDFARAVEAWQRRLAPLAEALPDEKPPRAVFERAITAIADRPAPAVLKPESTVIVELERARERMRQWRNISVAALAAAACFAMLWIGGVRQPWIAPEQPVSYVALLSGEGGKGVLVTVNVNTRSLSIRNLGLKAPPEETYELWLVKDRPVALGEIGEHSYSLRPISHGISLSDFSPGTALAISMEKASEPIQDGPKGPILFKGSLILQTPDRNAL
jgi:anti-sigma-K factor RskA